ncbi:MAG: polynucleotide adenylyltransferase PcnB [Gammaproteobacteria bacterium]|nr:polynucleotide adenylyltransferase PcnB [Gammaproteobacteria bacterium]MCK5262718.1 polynucleotide adenylyltransferase PcnB [Gammaproteobacteria bacterium]
MLKWLKKRRETKKRKAAAKTSYSSEARIISRAEHGISRKNIDESALKVLYRLNKAGYEAYLVGGAVRDLLLGKRPKDFDVATDATPEQVKELFRNCRLIGRRFRLAHIHFGRHIIEVATFRGHHGESQSGHQDESGRILRDNVYGDLEQDVWRRDFTVNALYYNVADFSVVDFVGGFEDVMQKRLRLIGDPDDRYREDPVRMIRAIRFSAKLGFSIDESCQYFIRDQGVILRDVPAARLYEEVLKLFHSGHAIESFRGLREYYLLEHLFPEASDALNGNEVALKFLQLAMQSTDERIHQNKPVTPAFLFAALLWAPLQLRTEKRLSNGEPHSLALQKSASAMVSEQVRHVSIPKRFTTVMRDIWALQSRFSYRQGKRAASVFEHPKFRAGYDFLCLRAKAGEISDEDCRWWTEFQENSPEAQKKKTESHHHRRRPPRRRHRSKKIKD